VFACKIVKRDDLSDRSGSLEKFEEEIRIWRSLPRHPSLLPLLEMHRTPFATFLFSPFLPGSLLDVMRREGGSDKTARKWFPGVVAAVSALHEGCEGFEGRVLHGDLKLDNFLVDHSGGVIVCDFYMAQIVDTVPLPRPRVFHPLESLPPSLPSASLPYAPPELLRAPPPPPSLAQDIWALGVILHALLTGKLPFVDAFDPRLQMKILRGQWDPPLYLGKEWLECLRGCLDGNRETRWDIRRVRECDAVIGWHEVKSRSRSRSRHRPSEYEYGADPLTGRSDVFSRNRSRSASATRRLVGFDPEKQVATNLETMSISRGRSATRQQLMPTPVPPIITTFERGRPGTPSPSRRASRSPHATITAPSNPDSRSRSRTPWEERFGGMELGVVDEETGYRSRKGRSGSRGRGT
jgi:serine/threonine protein kinase